jgi:hypothetical protein
MSVGLVVRCMLTSLLLIEVWRHSHWSVAASLTLVFISIEVEAKRSAK